MTGFASLLRIIDRRNRSVPTASLMTTIPSSSPVAVARKTVLPAVLTISRRVVLTGAAWSPWPWATEARRKNAAVKPIHTARRICRARVLNIGSPSSVGPKGVVRRRPQIQRRVDLEQVQFHRVLDRHDRHVHRADAGLLLLE